MFQRAQEMVKVLHDRMRTTLGVVADLAESIGVPPAVTSFLVGDNGRTNGGIQYSPPSPSSYTPPPCCSSAQPTTTTVQQKQTLFAAPNFEETQSMASSVQQDLPTKRKIGKKRGLVGEKDLSSRVRPLEVEDAIDGSTYLARIIWCLGVAELEETSPLRPADIARMVMSRSPVSLEPPNVARYIRRSKPDCIIVDHAEGSSNFYKLNAKGTALFEEKFGLN
ncbi:MAG: hypothetical protein V1754_02995 [Pseudomonadota bacterium]